MPTKRKTKQLRKKKPAPKGRARRSSAKDPIRSGTLRSALDPTRTREFQESGPETEAPETGASAGDLEGLETDDNEDFESVAELVSEGQDLEAEELESIEKAPNADQGDLKPRKVPSGTKPGKFSDRNRL
ncbi:MAG TPA: hypothetical protein VFE02_07440 [Candidatus Acidoferrales bacterium]|jgi:hypothetical protein|nr:hypothetical protein [Candidatus Acidoferrales bacterium]